LEVRRQKPEVGAGVRSWKLEDRSQKLEQELEVRS
jgi:hypothetical protein